MSHISQTDNEHNLESLGALFLENMGFLMENFFSKCAWVYVMLVLLFHTLILSTIKQIIETHETT